MKRELKDCLQILKLMLRIARLRIKIRVLDRRNRRLRARLRQLDHAGGNPQSLPAAARQAGAIHNPQSNPPLVKIGPGGDYVREFYAYAGSMN